MAPPERSAQGHALSISEILIAILEAVSEDEADEYAKKDPIMLTCGLVCRYWFEHAMKILWAQPVAFGDPEDLTAIFSKVARERRQLYASCVKEIRVRAVPEEYTYSTSSLRGLTFPLAYDAYVDIDVDSRSRLPLLDGSNVRVLSINPEISMDGGYAQDETGMEKLLDLLANIFPNVEQVNFEDACIVHAGAMERFSAKLPRLVHLNDELVISEDARKWRHMHTLGGNMRPYTNNRPWSSDAERERNEAQAHIDSTWD